MTPDYGLPDHGSFALPDRVVVSARNNFSVVLTVSRALESGTVESFGTATVFTNDPSLTRLAGDNFSRFRNAILQPQRGTDPIDQQCLN